MQEDTARELSRIRKGADNGAKLHAARTARVFLFQDVQIWLFDSFAQRRIKSHKRERDTTACHVMIKDIGYVCVSPGVGQCQFFVSKNLRHVCQISSETKESRLARRRLSIEVSRNIDFYVFNFASCCPPPQLRFFLSFSFGCIVTMLRARLHSPPSCGKTLPRSGWSRHDMTRHARPFSPSPRRDATSNGSLTKDPPQLQPFCTQRTRRNAVSTSESRRQVDGEE